MSTDPDVYFTVKKLDGKTIVEDDDFDTVEWAKAQIVLLAESADPATTGSIKWGPERNDPPTMMTAIVWGIGRGADEGLPDAETAEVIVRLLKDAGYVITRETK